MTTIDDLKIESPSPKVRRKKRPLYPIIAAVLILLAAGAWVVRGYFASNPKEVEVFVVQAENSGLGGGFSAGGYLEVIPPGPTVVSSMVDGRVQTISVIEGQRVEAGQELVWLNDEIYRQEVTLRERALAEASAKLARQEAGFRAEEIAQANAELEHARARLKQAQAIHERNDQLLKSGVVSQKDWETSQADAAAAQADFAERQAEAALRERGYRKEDIEIARAAVATARAELEFSRWKLRSCVIRAPFSGVVLERFAQPGNWVSTASDRERAAALLSLVDPQKIQAWVDVNQRDIGRVSVGQAVTLTTDAEPGRPIEGLVLSLFPRANLQKNTVQVKVQIPKPPPDLRPEMSVKVTFLPAEDKATEKRHERRHEVPIPARALIRDGRKARVYVIVDGRARLREVEVATETGDHVFVQSGVAPGDRVVLDPQGLRDGEAVTAANQKEKTSER